MAVSRQDQKINRVRAEVRETIHLIGKGHEADEAATAQSCLAVREIAALRQELADEKAFRAALGRVGFDRTGTDLIIKGLDDQRGFQKGALEVVARVPFHDITTERLNIALSRHMATPECRLDMTRPVRADLIPGDVDPAHEFAPFLIRVFNGDIFPKVRAEMLARLAVYIRSGHAAKDFTAPDSSEPAAVAMCDLVTRLREGEQVPADEVQAIIEARFSDLFVPVKILKNDECVEGRLPMAFPKDASAFSLSPSVHRQQSQLGSVEGAGCIDAVIRDVNDPHRWHIAAATSNEDTASQNDQLARHHAAVQNSIEMDIPPFSKKDSLATLLFVSPCLMTPSRVNWIEADGPSLDEPELAALNALAVYRQLAQTSYQKQMDLTSIFRHEHQAIGGLSSATGGLGRSESQLVTAASAQFARAVRALGNPKRHLKMDEHGSGPLLLIMKMIHETGNALLSNFANDAENGLRKAAPGLRHLAAQADEQGVRAHGDPLKWLAQQIEAIGPADRERKRIECRRPQDQDRPLLLATYLNTLSRQQQFSDVKQRNHWSKAIHSKWEQARDQASPVLWQGLLQGSIDIRDLEADRSGRGVHVLSLSGHEQAGWAGRFPKTKARLATESPSAARYLEREPEAQSFRLNTVLTPKDLSGLTTIQHQASPALWQAVLNQVVSVEEVVTSRTAGGYVVLDVKDETQNRWLNSRLGIVEMTSSAMHALKEPATSEQHADFLEWVRPALERGMIHDSTLYTFNVVAKKGSARVYESVKNCKISAAALCSGVASNGQLILDQPKLVQNQWLRETLSNRTWGKLPTAAAVIEAAYAEAQASIPVSRRRKRTTR